MQLPKLSSRAKAEKMRFEDSEKEMISRDPIDDRENRSLLRSRGLVVYGVCLVVLGNVIGFTASAMTVHPDVPEFVSIAAVIIVPTFLIGIGLTMFLLGLAGIQKHRR